MRAQRLLAGLGLTLGITLAGVLVSATIPDPAGTIHGCYTRSTGTIRVIDNSVTNCKQGETSLQWNVQGPQGPQGEPGETGPAGPQGVPGEPADDNILTVAASPALPENSVAVPGLGTVIARCLADGTARIVVQGQDRFGSRTSATTRMPSEETIGGFGDFIGTLWLQTLDASGVWRLDYSASRRVVFNLLPGQPVLECAAAATITVVDPA